MDGYRLNRINITPANRIDTIAAARSMVYFICGVLLESLDHPIPCEGDGRQGEVASVYEMLRYSVLRRAGVRG